VTVFADDDEIGEAYAREPCLHRDGVVGRRVCPRYGEWATAWPAVAVTFGVGVRHLAPGPVPSRPPSTARSASSVTNPSTIDDAPPSSRMSISEQVAIAPNPLTFFAFEVEFSPSSREKLAPGERQFSAGSQLVAGVHGGNKTLRLGVEVAGGIRIIDAEADNDEFVLEARARGDMWLTPWMTLGVLVGSSIIERGDWMMGLSVGTHTNAFGGR
jgi:hypothetical protein